VGRPIADILEKLGAEQEGDDAWALDGAALGVESVFGGEVGACRITLFSEQAFGFAEPPEMAALGVLWVANVERADDVRSAVRDAHGRLKTRLESDRKVMTTGGYTPELEMPEPEVTASTSAAGYDVRVAVNANGGLEVRSVAGRPVPAKSRLALEDAADADKATLRQAVLDVVRKLKDAGLLTGRGVFDAPTVRAPIGEEEDDVEQDASLEDDGDAPPSAESSGLKKAPPRPRRRSRRSREGDAASEASQAPEADGSQEAEASAVDASEPDVSQVESLLPAPSEVVDKVEQHSAEADLDDEDDGFDWSEDATRQVGAAELAKVAAGELGGPTAQASAPSMSEVGMDLDDVSDEAPSELVDDELSDLADPSVEKPASSPSVAEEATRLKSTPPDVTLQGGPPPGDHDSADSDSSESDSSESDSAESDSSDELSSEEEGVDVSVDGSLEGDPDASDDDIMAALEEFSSEEESVEASVEASAEAPSEDAPSAEAAEDDDGDDDAAQAAPAVDEVDPSAEQQAAEEAASGFDDLSDEALPPEAEPEEVSDSQLMSLPSASAEQLPDDADDSQRPTGPVPVQQAPAPEAKSESAGKPQTSDEEAASKQGTGEQSDPWKSGVGSGPPSEHVPPFQDPGSDDVEISIDDLPPEVEVGTPPPPEMDVGTGPVQVGTPSAENTYQALADVIGDGLRTGKTGAFVLDADAFRQLQDAGAEQDIADLVQEEAELEARLAAVRSRLVMLRAGKAQAELANKEETSGKKRSLAEKMAKLRSQKSDEGSFVGSGEDISITGPGEGPPSGEEPGASFEDFDDFDENDPYTRPVEVGRGITAPRPQAPLPSAATPTDVQADAAPQKGSSEEAFADGVRVEELAAELGHEATQMVDSPLPAADLDENADDEDGGVFESPSSASVSVASSLASGSDEEEEEDDDDINPDGATRVALSPLLSDDEGAEPKSPPTVGIVVSDTRALARLRKHLAPAIPGLLEIGDLDAVADHDDLESIAALVFIRPRKDTKTLDTLIALSTLDPAPRTLVLSSDKGFDEADGVGLRLSLAKRVADVAQQVVDGLEELGISTGG
jgi:hypothetical protein